MLLNYLNLIFKKDCTVNMRTKMLSSIAMFRIQIIFEIEFLTTCVSVFWKPTYSSEKSQLNDFLNDFECHSKISFRTFTCIVMLKFIIKDPYETQSPILNLTKLVSHYFSTQ